MSTDEIRNVLVVDSDPATQALIQQTLGARFATYTAATTEDGLRVAKELEPCMLVAATQGQGLDGFVLCKRVKSEIEHHDIPVILLADGDSAETRLRGFDAGATDCLFRPIQPKMLATRLATVIKQQKKRDLLKEQVRYANVAAFTAMSSLGETGLVIEGIKSFNQCSNIDALANALLASVGVFDLHCAVELLMGEASLALSRAGPATELERSILQQLSSMDRITQFKNRLFIRYPRVRIVVNNLPLDDPDRCGRLRDHLAMLVEAADVRMGSLAHASQSSSRGEVISSTIQVLTGALSGIDMLQRQSRAAATTIRADVLMQVEQALAHYGLTEAQEGALIGIVQRGLEALADFQLAEAHLQDELSHSIAELQRAVADGEH